MRSEKWRALVTVIAIVAMFGSIRATPIDDARITKALDKLKSSSWEERGEGFYNLLGYDGYAKWDGRTDLIPSNLALTFQLNPRRSEEIKTALISLLDTENSTVATQRVEFDKTGKTLTEGYTNYYGDVIASVASLKDARALNALAAALSTGALATRGLAELGPQALNPVLGKLNSDDPITRGAATQALQFMASPENRDKFGDAATKAQIKNGLLRAAADRDFGVRIMAARALTLIPDADTVAVLEKLATSDPATLPGQKADEGGDFYPVRQAARRALQSLGKPIPNN
jgi:HEAT repeat protein